MARKKSNIHYIYKTTCLVTGRYYIGMHSTCNLDDGYMGSGKRLRYSIRKYGEENHRKEILEFFETRELLIEAEKKLITKDMLNDKKCMNLAEGGTGGHGARFLTKEQLIKGANVTNVRHKNKIKVWRSKGGSTTFKKYGLRKNFKYDWSDKKHKKKTIKLMRKIKKGHGLGKSNSQYGTCWMTKNDENKKIRKEELEIFINEGWIKGRTINAEVAQRQSV